MNSIKESYNDWAVQYDTNHNKTRDLEAVALKQILGEINFEHCLELGCGTGKNTQWILTKAKQITAVDFSENMLKIAREKINSEKVNFMQADVTQEWAFAQKTYDLITFSLMLEHIENLETVFINASQAIAEGGFMYIGELHPNKQYGGSKAKFETKQGTRELTCFTHHISDFVRLAFIYGFDLIRLDEHFDNNERNNIPRILTLLLRKKYAFV